MAKRTSQPDDTDTYQLYDQLDRLEELLEDMAALNVQSVTEAEARIAELNARIDALEDTSGE
ncbi:MAG: hypothetical protein IT335_03650 [Thermomicrobiales bacterium]|jgi:uncharacterized small protein (DUF1192 family)|nr:hypothetical protein [Thermomicrobiales bacterium]